MEIWKKVKGYSNYEVSNLGRVKVLNYRRSGKEKLFKASIDKLGYRNVCLTKDKKEIAKRVHILVAEAFLNHTTNGNILVVNHINLDKSDNRVENLEIVTNRENTNKKHLKSSSKYTGVSWNKATNKWMSNIHINKNKIYLGLFKYEIEASNAYQKALEAHNSTLL